MVFPRVQRRLQRRAPTRTTGVDSDRQRQRGGITENHLPVAKVRAKTEHPNAKTCRPHPIRLFADHRVASSIGQDQPHGPRRIGRAAKPVATRKLPPLMHAGKVSAEVSSAFHIEYDSDASDADIRANCSSRILLRWIADQGNLGRCRTCSGVGDASTRALAKFSLIAASVPPAVETWYASGKHRLYYLLWSGRV
jgi:hypothetical protein